MKVDTDSAPTILVESKVVDEPGLKVVKDSEPDPKVEESESEVEEPLIETPVHLPVEPTIELVIALTVIFLSHQASTTHCRSFYIRHDHIRSGYLWCKVQSVPFSS